MDTTKPSAPARSLSFTIGAPGTQLSKPARSVTIYADAITPTFMSKALAVLKSLQSSPAGATLLLLLLHAATTEGAVIASSKRPVVVVNSTNKIVQIIAIVIGSIISLGILFKVVIRIMIWHDDRKTERRIKAEKDEKYERWEKGDFREGDDRWQIAAYRQSKRERREREENEKQDRASTIQSPEEAHVKEEKPKEEGRMKSWLKKFTPGKMSEEETSKLLESMERGEAGDNNPIVKMQTPQPAHLKDDEKREKKFFH
jgi:hypothetical protein